MTRLVLVLLLVAAPFAAKASCTISATGVAYGGYDVLSSSPVDSTGSITYDCQAGSANVTITLSKGNATTYARELVSGAATLGHNLYLDAAHTQVWGDGTEATEYHIDADPPDGTPVSVTIYGRVPARQDVPAGAYADSVVATVNF